MYNQVSSPAKFSGYEKTNPTKHILSIKKATKPCVLAFAESYDALWIAYSDTTKSNDSEGSNKSNNLKTNSVPLYGVTNGFHVNKTGDYTVIIEYDPQK